MNERILEMMELVKQGDVNSYLEKLSLLETLHIIDDSWGNVSTKNIVNCYLNSGFNDESTEALPITASASIFTEEFLEEWSKIDEEIEKRK